MPSEDFNKGFSVSLLSGSFVHIFQRRYSTFIFIKHNLFILKISKTYVFFLKTPDEYITRFGQRSRFHSGSGSPSLFFFMNHAAY